ncbi:gluconokinase [Arthrobacter sp. G.S.26]|uniref:gluconokinase n=1 Tax=Micrococcaceae TaxID=1268 RepID=UPI0025576E9D|nr:gluconokinase [Pseudarthrobacter sp. MEB009]
MSGEAAPLVVMGVCGCGKSTAGALLAARLGRPFLDGDDFHPAANKAKMAAGIPLADEDRTPWLSRLGQLLAGADTRHAPPVLACSALKRSYRDLLRSYAPNAVFVHLDGSEATITGRLSARAHEFMPGSLLASQLATLERLGPDEAHVLADITLPPELLVDAVARLLAAG